MGLIFFYSFLVLLKIYDTAVKDEWPTTHERQHCVNSCSFRTALILRTCLNQIFAKSGVVMSKAINKRSNKDLMKLTTAKNSRLSHEWGSYLRGRNFLARSLFAAAKKTRGAPHARMNKLLCRVTVAKV